MAAPSLFQIRVSASNVVVVAGDGFVWLPICWCTMLEVQTGLVMTQFQVRCNDVHGAWMTVVLVRCAAAVARYASGADLVR